jgi:Ca2+-binding EF-hand superfamily protein
VSDDSRGAESPARARSREEKRFNRADRDKDGRITRAEMMEPRRKAFAKLDSNHDGRLSFEEWAGKTDLRFERADADHNGWLSRAEFATTRRKTRPKAARCACRGEDEAGPAEREDH